MILKILSFLSVSTENITSLDQFISLTQYDLFWKRILFFTMITIALCSLLFIVSYILSIKSNRDVEKLSEYECGFEPFDHATRQPFDVHFFIVGILFLVFDVEIALIFPWVLGIEMINWFGFFVMLTFLVIITVGFIYEWHIGALQWPVINTFGFFLIQEVSNSSSSLRDITSQTPITLYNWELFNSFNLNFLTLIYNYLPLVIVLLSLSMIFVRNPIHALLSLIGVFFLVALTLISLKAEFLAMLFLIIYIGAVSILFLFVIMMFNLHKIEIQYLPLPYFYSWYFYIGVILPKFYFTILNEMSKFFYNISESQHLSIESFYFLHDIDLLFAIINPQEFWQEWNLGNPLYKDLLPKIVQFQDHDILEFSKVFYTRESLLFVLLGYVLLTAMVGAIALAMSLMTANNNDDESLAHPLTTSNNIVLLSALTYIDGDVAKGNHNVNIDELLDNWWLIELNKTAKEYSTIIGEILEVDGDWASWYHDFTFLDSHNLSFFVTRILRYAPFLSEYILGISCLLLLVSVAQLQFKPKGSFAKQKKVSNEIFILATLYVLLVVIVTLFSLTTFCGLTENGAVFNGDTVIYGGSRYIRSDLFVQGIKCLVAITTLIVMCSATQYVWMHRLILAEYGIFFIIFLFFVYFLLGSNNLITVIMNIIGFSLTIYLFILFDKFNFIAIEAGSKYFILSALSSGLFAGGIVVAYQAYLSTYFSFISAQNWNLSVNYLENNSGYVWLFCTGVVFGLLFKIGAVPGHLWLTNVYNGSSNPIVALFAVPVKIATFIIFMTLLSTVLSEFYVIWSFVIWFSSLASMLWGGLGALNANKTKAFIAYSSINQMGFMLIGFVCKTALGFLASLVYLIIYVLMQITFLYIFITTTKTWYNMKSRSMIYLTDFAQFTQHNLSAAILVILILFSMAGIPPLIGFFSKYFLFIAAFDQGYYSLIIIGMVASLISSLYYLNLINIMFFNSFVKHTKY